MLIFECFCMHENFQHAHSKKAQINESSLGQSPTQNVMKVTSLVQRFFPFSRHPPFPPTTKFKPGLKKKHAAARSEWKLGPDLFSDTAVL